MSKELKSLERIENYQVVIDIEKDKTATIKELLHSSCETLETALKDYETMKEIRYTSQFDLKQVNKEHKALEIISKKGVKLGKIDSVNTYVIETNEYVPSIYKVKEYHTLNSYYNLYVPYGTIITTYILN